MSPKISGSGWNRKVVPRRLFTGRAAVDEPGFRHPAAVALAPQLPIARHLDLEPVGERVDDADPDAVQTARGPVCGAAELAAGMQRRQDHLERGFLREAGMRIDRDPAAVVADRYPVAGGELELDARGMAGNGLVHGVVEHLGDEVMQPALVGAADKHAGAATNRLQPLEDLDILGGIAVRGSRVRHVEEVGHGANIRIVSVSASSMRCQPDHRATKYWKHRRRSEPAARSAAANPSSPREPAGMRRGLRL